MTNTPHARCIAQYGAFTTPVVGLATTSDGTLLVVAPQEGDLELWDISSGSRVCSIPVPVTSKRNVGSRVEKLDEVYSLALSDDGLFVAASFRETGDIYLWTFEGDLLIKIEGDGSFTRAVNFVPATSLLVVVLHDTRIQLWDAVTQQLHVTLPGADEHYTSYLSGVGRRYRVACSSDGSQIALDPGTNRRLVSVWEIKQKAGQMYYEGQKYLCWNTDHFSYDVKFRPLHTQLYHLVKKTIEGYDTHMCNLVTQIRYPGMVPVRYCFSPQGDLLAFADNDGVVYLWSIEKEELLFQFDAREVVDPGYLYYDASVQQMAWLSQCNLLATVGLKKNDSSGVNTIKLWQLTFL